MQSVIDQLNIRPSSLPLDRAVGGSPPETTKQGYDGGSPRATVMAITGVDLGGPLS